MLNWLKKTVASNAAINRNILKDEYKITSSDVFSKLAFKISRRIEKSKQNTPFSSPLMFEKGKIAETTPYFFVQPLNEMGILFERNSKGWSICRAEKIVHEGRFLRSLESIDIATVENIPGKSFVRVYSSGFGQRLLPFMIYEETIWESLFQDFIEVKNNV